MRNYRTLVLNANYRPLAIISWERAIVLVANHQVDEVDFYKHDSIKDGKGRVYTIPAVIAVKKFVKRPNLLAPFCKKYILQRDFYTCQYCHEEKHPRDLTLDHVIPRSKWTKDTSPTNWENIVACCVPCNRKKGSKTPEEAGMPLSCKPSRPKWGESFLGISPYRDTIPNEWVPYLQHLPHFSKFGVKS